MVFATLALAPAAFAVDPPPGGGYPNEVTALGEDALSNSTVGSENTAVGFRALYSDTTGGANVAIGSDALYTNTTGAYNVAIGDNASVANTTGGGNVAVGYTALQAHTNGFDNVAIGFDAMSLGSTGSYNTAIGNVAMAFSTGSENVAIGDGAMNKSTGSNNIAVGQSAGLNMTGNTNIVIGSFAGQNLTTGANNIEIGSQGAKKDTGTIRIGDTVTQKKTFIAGISGVTVASGVGVVIATNGQLGTVTSSARYKEAIQPMKEASEAILSLEPVKFRYKKELDPEAIPQFGLVAEQVAKVDPDLVARDESGQPYTVRYEAVNAMLLNEFLKEHRGVQDLKNTVTKQEAMMAQQNDVIARQEKEIATLTAAMKEQAAQIQKVSAQVAGDQTAPRVVSTGE